MLQAILQGCAEILGEDLIGLYLFGSLTYGDFNPASSDIEGIATRTRLSTLKLRNNTVGIDIKHIAAFAALQGLYM